MLWNVEVMNHQQVQQRPLVSANGVNRRRPDRDPGLRVDSNHRSDAHTWRSSIPDIVSVDHPNANNSFPSGSGRHSTEKDDAGSLGRIRGSMEKPLHDRLLFLTMCLIGQPVEVQVTNGSIYSGIFHTANAEKDFGVVLKMASLTKDGSAKVAKNGCIKEAARKAPVKTLIIYEKDFVQITAKDVSLTADSYSNGRIRENRNEILTDSVLSQGRCRDVERELKPWKPDSEAPRNLGLESTFQSTWNRNWDQFETNKALFGIESTFDEELYTTKLERGPQTREREREAWRIAREIEGQSTRNLHLAEEREFHLTSEFEHLDEESRFSSVIRLEVTDAGEEEEHNNVDEHNEETFGNPYVNSLVDSGTPSDSSASTPSAGEPECKAALLTSLDHMQVSSPESSFERSPLLSPLIAETASIEALNINMTYSQVPEDVYREFQEFKLQETAKKSKRQRENEVNELKSFSQSLKDRNMKEFDPHLNKAAGAGGNALSMSEGRADSALSLERTPVPVAFTSAAAAVPSSSTLSNPASLMIHAYHTVVSPAASTFIQSDDISIDTSMSEMSVETHRAPDVGLGAIQVSLPTDAYVTLPTATAPMSATVNQNPEGTAMSTTSNPIPTVSSSAMLSQLYAPSMSANAKVSSLNPNAKEFKLNPNARSFKPGLSAAHLPSPVHQGPVYMAAGLHPIAPIQMPVGLGLSQIVQQSVESAQFSQYNSSMAVASAAPYMQPPSAFVPNVAGAGPAVLPVQATIKLPPQSQQQVVAPPYTQQQVFRYLPQAAPLQPTSAYPHPSGQLYPQQVMYAQPGPVLYIQQFPQGMMQGQPLPLPQQGPLPPQPASQQPKYRGGGIEAVHFNLTPTYLAGQHQHLQQSQIAHLHNPIQTSPTGLVPGTVPGAHPSHGVVTVSEVESLFGHHSGDSSC
ncbi:hypothetical protein O6H91_07G045100 [Diphasiastrum complanatum]|uniref:Uncharacterized protein n=1 Tax=Diphasiastrum complanatum TaxID=34168 RepID=A0ACC2D5F7_DIPCM|nr:hypothetical protein O6H91_07G045100 [Diphasiastrum complanatum]